MTTNNKGQLSIIAALLVAIVLVGTILITFSRILDNSIQESPQILSAIDEVDLAIDQILSSTIRYYGSVLKVTGNSSYAKSSAQTFLYDEMKNIPRMYPSWGISLSVGQTALQVSWFSNYSYSSGALSITYDLAALGLSNVNYNSSSSLMVQTNNETTTGRARLTVTRDAGSPVTNLGTQNFGFYSYNYTTSTWNVTGPNTLSMTFTNGTYVMDLPQGVDSSFYVVQVEDQRGLMVLSSSLSSLTSGLNWGASQIPTAHYVDDYVSGGIGSHSNFAAQQNGPDTICDNLTEGNVTGTQSTAYYPSNYTPLGLTQYLSGSLTNLTSDDNIYMTFGSQTSATSPISLYSNQTTTSIGSYNYYNLNPTSATQTGTTLTASMSSVSRSLFGKLVCPLTGIDIINASTWTVNYRAWEDAPTNIALDNVGSGVNNIVGYIPITITNTQSSATPNPFQEKITWNPSTYAIYEASGLGNIRFYSDSAFTNLLYAWLESCTPTLSNTATSATAWIKLTSPIAASGGTLTIYMAFLSTSTAFDGNYWGDAPNLSSPYGQYDNGANVFNFYDNFNGTSLSSKWTTVKNSAATVTVNNGVTFTTSTSSGYAFVVSATQTYPQVAEAYLTSANSTVGPMMGVSTTTSVNNFIALYNGYSVDEISSQLELVSERSSGGTPVTQRSLSGINIGIWQLIWSATGSESASDGVYTLTGTSSSSSIANYRIYVGQSNYGAGSNAFRWARMRAYPPSNVMPSVSLGTTGFRNSVSWSHTTSSGSNRIMIVGVSIKSSSVSVSSITYGSQSLTFIRRDTNPNGIRSELWYLIAPASGTATVTVNLSNNAIVTGGSCTYTGVSQASPIDAHNGVSGTSSSPFQSVTVNTANSFLISNIAINGTTAVSSEGSGQTQRWDQYYSNLIRGHGSEEGPDGTGIQSMYWTLSGSADWAVSVVALKPATIPAVGHASVDILIRQSNGTVRSTIPDVAASLDLSTTPQTLSGTYAWSAYTVLSQTDYLEIDYYVDVTTAGSSNAYLNIDNSSLPSASQTSVTNVLLPSQFKAEIVFEGTINAGNVMQVSWTVDSKCSIAGVNVTCQLYNNQTSYPTSGDGYQSAIIGTANVIQSQTITANPSYYVNSTNWFRIKVLCISTTSQFNWSGDFIQFGVNCTTTTYKLDLEEQWTSVDYNNTDQLAIYAIKGNSTGYENVKVDVWNGATWNIVFTDLANGWNNATVSSYLTSSDFTIRFTDATQTGDPSQNTWQVDAALLRTNISLYGQLQNATVAVELLQNGTMLWLGQQLTTATVRPIPPIPVQSFHVNQTLDGIDREVPFQIEDWASNYRVPLGLSSNASVFSSRNMLVYLATPQVSRVTVWWNGSDNALQTPLAYTNRYFTVNTTQRTVTNGILNLTIDFSSGTFNVISTVGTSSCTATLFRINNVNASYGAAEPNYAITNGPVRAIIHHEVEWGNGGIPNCSDILAHLVITLPANATYYTYALRLMFLSTTQTRNITDLCPISLSAPINVIQTENGTTAGYPTVTNTTGLFYNYSQAVWAHHWSQFISGTKGSGIMFTDTDNQKLYVFDSPGTNRGALKTDSVADKIELLPVTMSPLSLPSAFDVTWHGAIVTFDGTTPIYMVNQGNNSGIWVIAEYPPSLT